MVKILRLMNFVNFANFGWFRENQWGTILLLELIYEN